jgi:redox-sensitive bicupin YhaK (pirin superfamily)
MGNSAVISPDEIQRMSAGTGIRHSEFNHHHDKQVHLLQIWIIPDKKGLTPSYEQKIIKQNHPLTLIASGTPDAGAVLIHQDINIYRGVIDHGSIDYVIKDKRAVWVHVIEGVLTVNGHILDAGDSVGIEHLKNVYFSSQQKVVFILFDLI